MLDDTDGKTAPTRYCGKLTPEQAAAGMNAALRNARRLASDARLLFDAGRLPSAASLAALAIEEAGKRGLVRVLMGAPTSAALKQAWAGYRSHRAKNGMWIMPELALNGARHLTDFAKVLDPKQPHTAILDSVKQLGFYSDCYGNCNWSEPATVIDRALAEQLVQIAETLCKARDVTVRELELWTQIVMPKSDTPEAFYAVVEWQRAMFEEGLSSTTPEEMAAFILPEAKLPH